MIYFDKRTLAVLRCIKRSGKNGITWAELQKKFGDDADIYLLMSFTNELYISTCDSDKKWLYGKDLKSPNSDFFRSYSTPKANELIEKRLFDFWKWIIPTLISVIALVISVISFISQVK